MSDTVNIVITVAFVILSVALFFRWSKVKGKVIIQDQQWSTMRLIFAGAGVLSFLSLMMSAGNATFFDYVRIAATIICVSIYMMARDGIGEEGIVTSAKFTPWSQVRGWDYEDRKNVRAVYFTVESTDEKHPDSYKTKELDFAKTDKEHLMKFLRMNVGGKYLRMKKKG